MKHLVLVLARLVLGQAAQMQKMKPLVLILPDVENEASGAHPSQIRGNLKCHTSFKRGRE